MASGLAAGPRMMRVPKGPTWSAKGTSTSRVRWPARALTMATRSATVMWLVTTWATVTCSAWATWSATAWRELRLAGSRTGTGTARLVGDVTGLCRAVGVDVGDSTPYGTVGVGEANIEGPAEFPAASGGRLLNRPADRVRAWRPLLRPGTPPMVPVTCGAPLLGSCADGAAESRGAKPCVPCRNPGHTNASSSSATSKPAPAIAASGRTAVVASGANLGDASMGTGCVAGPREHRRQVQALHDVARSARRRPRSAASAPPTVPCNRHACPGRGRTRSGAGSRPAEGQQAAP